MIISINGHEKDLSIQKYITLTFSYDIILKVICCSNPMNTVISKLGIKTY